MMDEVDYLKAELDDLRYREQRRMDDEIRAHKERDRERKAVYEERLRTANDWSEALQNQMVLMGREAVYESDGASSDDPCEIWFTDGKQACERALELWKEIETSKQSRVEQLRRELDGIQDEIRLEVAARLNDENQRPGWASISTMLVDGNLGAFLWW